MMKNHAWMTGLIAMALVACGSNNDPVDGGPIVPDSGRADSGGGTDAGGDTDAGGSAFMSFTGCENEGDYETGDTSVAIAGFSYNPACLRVPAGTAVMIAASAVHPLASRDGGTAGGPIPAAGSAATAAATYTFAAPGFYPYRCTVHEGAGMVGVIWVE